MNLSAPFVVDFFWDGKFEKFFPYIDLLFGNESEAAALGKRLGCSVSETILFFPQGHKRSSYLCYCNYKQDDIKEIALKASQLPKLNQNRDR